MSDEQEDDMEDEEDEEDENEMEIDVADEYDDEEEEEEGEEEDHEEMTNGTYHNGMNGTTSFGRKRSALADTEPGWPKSHLHIAFNSC